MAEKKNTSNKNEKEVKTTKKTSKKVTAKKTQTKTEKKKSVAKKVEPKKEVKKEIKKEEKKEPKKEVVVDTYEAKIKANKKKNKFKTWFNNLTLEQVIIGGVTIIAILLIVLIMVSTKNTKTKNGDDIVAQVEGKVITANDLYNELKKQNGRNVTINMIDNYLLDKEYETTDDMKESAEATLENYKSTYGDSYESFLEYNGIKDDAELKEILIRNTKLNNVTEDYIKDNLTEKEMKEYYENSIKGDIKASHILIGLDVDEDATDEQKEEAYKEAKKKADEVIEKLKNGANFSDLAKEYSTDESSKKNGGDLGFFNTGEMVQEFEDAAYKLDVNEYTTEPVKTTYGYHIIMKTDEKEKPTYEKSKETIIEKLVAEKKENDETISVKAMDALRKKYKLNIKDKTIKSDYDSYMKQATTTTTTSSN